jgi:hypothetical protein
MHPQIRLILASIAFAVAWTAFMIWRIAPDTAGIVILVVCGAIGGMLWYVGMRRWLNLAAKRS